MGSHAHAATAPAGLRGRRLLVGAAVLVVLATLAGLVLLRPTAEGRAERPRFAQGERTSGTVVATELAPCSAPVPGEQAGAPQEGGLQCLSVLVRLTDGPDRGREVAEVADRATLPGLAAGRDVVLLRGGQDVPFEERYQLIDSERGPPLAALALLFVVAVLAVGRLRGLLALVGLAVSLLVVVGWLVPALLSDRPPVLTAVVGGSSVMVAVLLLAHGPGLRTVTALLGTTLGLLVTVGLAALFVDVSALTGLSSDETAYVQVAFPGIDLRGLLLAGIVIGTLGVLDDVTVTQVSTVWELRAADQRQSRRGLYRAAMRVGRDHLASTTNTLLLAYAGASLPILVLFSTSGESLANGVTANVVAEEVVRTLAGGLGLLSAVPLTTALAAFCCPPDAGPPGTRVDPLERAWREDSPTA